MSTIDRPASTTTIPPLAPGQRLDRATFHERYEAMPPGTWAELIGGEVFMPSPLFDDHGGIGENVSLWLGHYRARTPGLPGSANATTILGDDVEVQPDHQLRLPPERGGSARVVAGYVHGPPELVVEVSRSSQRVDLGRKKDDYERGGVPEYLVVGLDPDRVLGFALRDGRYQPIPPGPDGLLRSEVFPGLWLDPRSLLGDDLPALLAALDRGLATPEHAAFVKALTLADRPLRPDES